MTTENVTTATPVDSRKAGRKPEGGQNRSGPLSEQEISEIVNAVSRTPGLGRIILSLVRNRNARVLVPETALGGEMFTIVAELDRVSARGERALARSLTLENLQIKNTLQERALGLIEPLASLTAEIGLLYDNPNNPILRHSRTKALARDMLAAKKAAGKKTSEPSDGAPAAASE